MTDIVERLRMEMRGDRHADLGREAADEIERLRGIEQFVSEASRQERDGLRAEIERLRAALQQIADDGKNCQDYCRSRARRALEQKP